MVAEIWADRQRRRRRPATTSWPSCTGPSTISRRTERHVEVARDLILIHMGSQSNLYAALAWTLVNLLLHPDAPGPGAGRRGRGAWCRCAYESIRLAQRSITLRQVLRPVELDDGERTYRVDPGIMIATMLSVTNPSAAPGLDRFDPDHYQGRRLAPSVVLPTKEVVSTFGHGIHTCPGPALLHLGHRHRRPGPARAFRLPTPLHRGPSPGPADRRGGPRRRPVCGGLPGTDLRRPTVGQAGVTTMSREPG